MSTPASLRRWPRLAVALPLLLFVLPHILRAQPLQIVPDSLSLPVVRPGVPAQGRVQLRNTGDSELDLRLKTEGAGFAVDPASLKLQGGDDAEIRVIHKSPHAGEFSGRLVVEVKGFLKTQRQTVPLHAQVSQASLTISPPPAKGLDLGAVAVGTSAHAALTVKNSGKVTARVDSVLLERGGEGFSMPSAGAVSLKPQEQVTIRVDFQPRSRGTHEDVLVLVGPDTGPQGITVALRGRGLAPQMMISPIPEVGMDFGRIDLGDSVTRPLTVLNVGDADLRITDIEISSGAFRSDFDSTVATTVQPGARIDVNITFLPRYEGTAKGLLTLSSNDPEHPQIIMPVVGTSSQSPPRVDILNDSKMDFGSVAVGKSVRDHLLLWNRGGAPFTSSMSLQGQAPDDFVLELPSVLLEPGAVRKIAIDFAPRSTGPREAELQVRTESGLHSIRLLGVGKFLELTPKSLDFDRVQVGKSSQISAEIYNFGNADFTVTNVVSSNPEVFPVQCSVSPGNKFILPADGLRPLLVAVSFSPGSRGVFNGVLQLQGYWDGAFESREIMLTGKGIAANIELQPAGPFQFGYVVLGQKEAQTLVATNTGDTDLRVEVHPESEEAYIEPAKFSLGPGKSITLKLFFQPSALGARSTKVRLITNAVKARALPIQVTGKGELDNVNLERVVAVLASRGTHFDTLEVSWNNTPVMLLDATKVDLVFRVPEDIRRAMIGRKFFVDWTKLDENFDPQGAPTKHEIQIQDTGESHLLLEDLNLRLLEKSNPRVRLRISTQNHPDGPLYGISQIFEAGGWKWEFEAKPLISFFSVRPSRHYTDSQGNRVKGKTERLIGLPGIAFFGFHNRESNGVSGIHLTAIGNVLEALSTDNSIAVSLGVAVSFYKDRFLVGLGRDVYDHRTREWRQGTKDYILTFKYWGLSK